MTQYARLEVIPPAGVEYDPRMAVPHVIGDVEHPAHPGDPCFNVALIAPEPGADAAWSSRAFEAMRREVGSLRDGALVKERQHADLQGAAAPNGWTNHVAAYDEVLAAIDELEELS